MGLHFFQATRWLARFEQGNFAFEANLHLSKVLLQLFPQAFQVITLIAENPFAVIELHQCATESVVFNAFAQNGGPIQDAMLAQCAL